MREVEGRERVPQELQTSRAIVERGRICGPRVEREPDVLATSFLEGGIRIDSEIPDDLGMLGAMPVRETSSWSRRTRRVLNSLHGSHRAQCVFASSRSSPMALAFDL